jgi:nicotinamidase-related amidase
MAKRLLVRNQCCGLLIDVQRFFLSQVGPRVRSRIKTNLRNYVRLFGHFGIPVIVTLERPVAYKGSLPREINKCLGDFSATFHKNYFDLCKEKEIRDHLNHLNRRQVIVAGCETDVCVLQSCLGLLNLGYEVYVVEELLFSSSDDVHSAVARMKAEGVVFLTYKTLFYELVECVEPGQEEKGLPVDLCDSAV